MAIQASTTVGELAAENSNSKRIFEKLGIDYCCGGKQSLAEACKGLNLPVEHAISLLEVATSLTPEKSNRDWQNASLRELVEHIVDRHHSYVKSEIPRLQQLLKKVCGVHGARHPELAQIETHFAELSREMVAHMMKEEQVLFPFIVELENRINEHRPAPRPPFGSVQNPIRMMLMEHDSAGNEMREIRQLSSDYLPPAAACVSYQTLFAALRDFETDLHEHIHLENNILFPRAEALEENVSDTAFECLHHRCSRA